MEQESTTARRTFVLRCWPEQDGRGNVVTWRFTLEDVATREQHGFADAATFQAFIKEHFGVSPSPADTGRFPVDG